MESIIARVDKTIYHNDSNLYSVLSCEVDDDELVVVGNFPEFNDDTLVEFYGDYIDHIDYGIEFKASSYSLHKPETLDEIENFLSSGLIKGVGKSLASQIVEKFALETLEIIENVPSKLLKVSGIGAAKLKSIVESYNQVKAQRTNLMFLQKYGLTNNQINKIINVYKENTEAVLSSNPYALVKDVDGIGFKTADSIALKIGTIPQNSPFRIEEAFNYILDNLANEKGDLYIFEDELIEEAKNLIDIEYEDIQSCLNELINDKKLIIGKIDSKYIIQKPYYHYCEKEIAGILSQRAFTPKQTISQRRIIKLINDFEKSNGIKFDFKQNEAIQLAVKESLLVITGGPGTGKTTILNCILHILKNAETVFLCAPTGRAAKKMSNVSGAEAKTIHRLLGISREEKSFRHDENNPLNCDCLIVDESSMLDVSLARSLFKALKADCRLILLGDVDQLPPVGPGSVLRDIIESNRISCVRLDTLFRQKENSNIVKFSRDINSGDVPIINNAESNDFYMIKTGDKTRALNEICSLYKHRLPNHLEKNDIDNDIQILCPSKKHGLSTIAINKRIQELINPINSDSASASIEYNDYTFRINDKVINTKNDYELEWRNASGFYDKGVFNGDIGKIVNIDEKFYEITVEMEDGKVVVYPSNKLGNLELAYALTVHKSQGSEFNVVIIPLIDVPLPLSTRTLLYTAITRAKNMVIIIGDDEILKNMVNNNSTIKRRTRLDEFLTIY